jgi:Fur family ferric uptake transcriptional regulator
LINSKLQVQSPPQLLQESGFKVTKIRVAILEFLTEGHGPYTAQQIFQSLQDKGRLKSIDLVSVYRNLEKFVESGLVSRCQLADGASHFEFGQTPHHHHIVCTSCNRIDSMFNCPLQVPVKMEVAKGYTGLSHKLEFYGLCSNCQSN